MKDSLKLTGAVSLVLRDKDGNVKQTKEAKNLIVDTGLNFICDRMKDDETAMTHMALGSSTTAAAAGDTALGTQLGSRVSLTSSTVTDNQIVFVCSFPAGSGTGAVTEAGIFNAASAGTMLCRVVFSTVNKSADDTLQITWTISLSAS
jgi:hypothetical protein